MPWIHTHREALDVCVPVCNCFRVHGWLLGLGGEWVGDPTPQVQRCVCRFRNVC